MTNQYLRRITLSCDMQICRKDLSKESNINMQCDLLLLLLLRIFSSLVFFNLNADLYVTCWFCNSKFSSNNPPFPFAKGSQRERYRIATNASRFRKFRKVKSLEKIVAVRNSAYILRTLHGWEGTLYLPAAMNNYSAIHDPLQRNVT